MDTLVADSEAEKLIEDAKENSTKRLVKGLNSAKEVCRDFVKNGTTLSHVNIGKECVKRNGGPSSGTIDNDSKGYYHRLIKLYQDLVEPNETFKDAALNDLPIDIKVYIKQLESRNLLLEKITKEKFAKARRTEVISLTDTISQHDNLSDHANTVTSTSKLSARYKEVFQKLYDVIEYAEDELEFQGKENTERLVSKSTNVILLTPDELHEIKDALS